MMPHGPSYDPTWRRRWRLHQSRLWIVAAALGAATLYSTASIIHSADQRRRAGNLVAKSAAEHVAARGRWQLEALALATFAPVTVDGPTVPIGGREALASLRRRHRERQACNCREILPASALFRFEISTDSLELAPVGDSVIAPNPSRVAVIHELARAEGSRLRRRGVSTSHLRVDPRLGDDAVVTVVEYDDGRTAVAVYGLIANARAIVHAMFALQAGPPDAHGRGGGEVDGARDDSAAVIRLDRRSIRISTPDASAPLFGTIDSSRYLGTARSLGPLEGLNVTVALDSDQIPADMLAVTPRAQLWHNGVLLASTVLVLGVAIGALRREVALARARADFIAGVSHDLRMPLAQILIASETLTLGRTRDEAARETLASSILRETRRLIGLVENVLLFSRSGAVELRPRLEPIQLSALFSDVVDAVRLSVDDSGQSIEVADTDRLAILGDRHLVRQALVNLVDNAIKYGSAGQRIWLGAARQGPDCVRLYVDDQGLGIPLDERERVFVPYERLSRDQTSERTGSGLGLAVVRYIARACGGEVWLDDAPGGGARVIVELRAAIAADPIVVARQPVGIA